MPAALIAICIAFGALSIASTYRIFSHTYDEPAHLAAGLELLDSGIFSYEQQHPPLARLAVALGPYFLGARSHHLPDIFDEGLAILYEGGDYAKILRAARLGVLPFFVAFVALAAAWAWHDFGAVAGTITALVLSTTPPVLAHGGLATTDLAVAAMILTALFAFRLWLDNPDLRHGIL